MREILIDGRPVGLGHPTYIVAEAGINHDGDMTKAREMVDAAREAGVDAIKFQAFTASEFCGKGLRYQWKDSQGRKYDEHQRTMFKRYQIERKGFTSIARVAGLRGLSFFVTATSPTWIDFAFNHLDVPCFKVGSDDIIHLPLLRKLSTLDLPVILSTGMATHDEIRRALIAVMPAPTILLHCVSLYPTPKSEWNLSRITTLRRTYAEGSYLRGHSEDGPLIGYSDHTEGIEAAVASVYLGSVMIEKHFTLDKKALGPDHRFSLNPKELKDMVERVREAEEKLGLGSLEPGRAEYNMRRIARRVLVARVALKAGQEIEMEHVSLKRAVAPTKEQTLDPDERVGVVGRKVARDLRIDDAITVESLCPL